MNNLWLGTEHSFEVYCNAMQAMKAYDPMRDDDQETEGVRIEGSVAVIELKGSLIEGRAGFGRYFGMMGYLDLADMLVGAVMNPRVTSILLDVNSGGGQVAGVMDAGEMLSRVSSVKPVVTYTGGTMASAAMWVGAASGTVLASQTAEVGSLGVIMVHMERSKQLEDAGVKATIIRSGKFKSLANPYEPLTAAAEEQLQAKADQLYDLFLGNMAEYRKLSTTRADSQFGQGRTFIGAKAMEVGLVDQITNYEGALRVAQALGSK
jgi:signal peptide peptidase SppA